MINVIRRREEHAVIDIGTIAEQPLQGVSFAVLDQAAFPLGCHVSRFIEDRQLLTSGVRSGCMFHVLEGAIANNTWRQ